MKIIGLDSDRSSADEGMGERYLELDDYPHHDWVSFFQQVHKEYFSMSKRRARVEGKYIVVNCLLDEVQSQINQIKEQLTEATNNFNKYEAQKRMALDAEEAALLEKKSKADNVFKKLDF